MFESVLGKWQGMFEEPADPALDHEVVAIEHTTGDGYTCFSGPMKVEGALVRTPDGHVSWVQGWHPSEDATQEPAALWEYWTCKGGGNGFSAEVAFLRAHGDHVTEAVALLDKQLRAIPLAVKAEPNAADAGEPVRWTSDHVSDEAQPDGEHSAWSVPEHLADTLTWALAAQLVRRHPETLWAVNTHPLDGFYNCLAICDTKAEGRTIVAQMNRRGTSLALPDGVLWHWTRGWETDDPRTWVLKVEQQLGLHPPTGGLPASSPSSLVVRWISQFMSMQLGARDRWSTAGGLPESDLLSSFRGLDGGLSQDDWRYWTLTSGAQGKPAAQIVLSIEGILYARDQDPIHLVDRHSSGGSIAMLVLDTVPRLLG